jgi:hypothetical protein
MYGWPVTRPSGTPVAQRVASANSGIRQHNGGFEEATDLSRILLFVYLGDSACR